MTRERERGSFKFVVGITPWTPLHAIQGWTKQAGVASHVNPPDHVAIPTMILMMSHGP